jgi:mannose-1-phosphate guanylyltransferase/mannose-1-phosphate guanylyltransferase/phosphomannomutase
VADFLGDDFLVISGDALTDIDLAAMRDFHRSHGGIATLATKRVADTSQFGVVITGADGRVQGFQEKPDPAEALSDIANCMIYAFRPEVFEYFPDDAVVDFAHDVFPALLAHDVPFHAHVIGEYWNDVGSIPEYVQGNLDAVSGAVAVSAAGELLEGGTEDDPAIMPGGWELAGKAVVGEGAAISAGARVDGPAVIGAGAKLGGGSRVRHAVVLDGAELVDGALFAGGIAGRRSR